MPKTLRDAFQWAEEKGIALPHFNVSDSTQLNAIAEVSSELKVPIVIGASESERDFFGTHQLIGMGRALTARGTALFFNADHAHTAASVMEAISAGYDSAIIDGAALPIEENIALVREVVARAKESGRDVLIEGELGYIGTKSALLDAVPEGAGIEMTTSEQALRFVRETGVDLFAPSVGNIHGMLKDAPEPKLDIARIQEIAGVIDVPLILHGASGNSPEDIKAAITAGIRMVHINTEIRVAYKTGIEKALSEHPNEIAPYGYLKKGKEEMKKILIEKVRLFTQ